MEMLKRFLSISVPGYGSGNGSGRGSGDGSGIGSGRGFCGDSGNGSGCGSGCGPGDGSGKGSGYGFGYGSGIKLFCGFPVVQIDGVQTIIYHFHGAIAKAGILRDDFSVSPCFVVKGENAFAHGKTLREAQEALAQKLARRMPVDKRINLFLETFGDPDKRYPASVFFDWHARLTGSCEAVRRAFAENHGIDLDNGRMSAREFLALTRDAYGCNVIRAVLARIGG